MMNPDDYIITRKRKKYRFAKFANASNCFEFEQWSSKPVDCVEVGAGNGLFSMERAKLHPEKQFAAIDVKGDRLQKGAYEALEQHVENIVFIRARADQIDELFPAESVTELWVTFPDPFPKKRSAGRRLTHPTYLKKYKQLLQKNGSLFLKHDNLDFFQWSLEQLVANTLNIKELSFDLHESELPAEYKLKTTYEDRWLAEGRISRFLHAVKSPSAD